MSYQWFGKPKATILALLVLTLLFAVACGAAATATPVPKAAVPAAPKAPEAAAPVAAPVATAVPTAAPKPTPAPVVAPKAKLDRLKIAVAPLGWDTNFTWLQSRSGQLDKRPALEYLIGIDRNTGAYIPELATKWEMAPDGKGWTVTLRKGIKFIDSTKDWGEFTAKDVRHAVFLITQTEAVQTDAGVWRGLMGLGKDDTPETTAKRLEASVEIVDPYQAVFHTKSAAPELFHTLSASADLVIESKARWDAGGKTLYEKKVVGTGPFEMIERKLSVGIQYKRVENHWRKTPEYTELEFRWVPEDITRLASLISEEVQISDVPRALHKDAVAKGMKIINSKLPAFQSQWYLGGLYLTTPEKLDDKLPFLKKEVRQAMNMAINRKAIADNLLGGQVQPSRVTGYHPQLNRAVWPEVWNPEWDKRFDELYGYNPSKAKALLDQAGYPNGFEFTIYLYTLPGLPEQVDIGQALAQDFKAIGLKPKLVELDFPRVRALYTTKAIHGGIFPIRHSLNPLEETLLNNERKACVGCVYEHPFIEERIEALRKTANPGERTRLLREIGDHKFNEVINIPLFWLFAAAAVTPKFIADYEFPGVITGFYTHLEYVKLAQ
jgi:peptide/nickel transport system substrate-binding protein